MALNRRDFLKLSAAGVGGALCTGNAQAVQREPKKLPPEAVGMLYDSTLCIGCKACMSACKAANGMPPEQTGETDVMWDTPIELSGKTINVIKVYRDETVPASARDTLVKDQAQSGYAFMKRHCLHCVDPSCVSACPVSAMTKDPLTGIVEHHANRCIGCRYCVYSCPFGVPKYEYNEAFGQIQKCQFCAHLQAKGEIPACCDVCPTGATLFGKVRDLQAEAERRMAKEPGETYVYPRGILGGDRPPHEARIPKDRKELYGDQELGGTQILYLAGVPFDKLGLPTNIPDYGYPTLSEGIQHMLYKWMIAPAVLLGGLAYVVHRNTQNNQGSESQSGSDASSEGGES